MRERCTRRTLLGVGSALGVASFAGCSAFGDDPPGTPDAGGTVSTPAGWPAFGRDAANTGRGDAGPTDYGAVTWRTPATTAPPRPGDRFPAPLVVDDTLLVGTWSDGTGARLYGLDPMDLSERWSKQVLAHRGFGTVADVVPADGSVFVLGPELARVG